MAITAPDAVKDQLLRDNKRLRDTGELLANKLMIASQGINLPGESGPYQDKTTYPKDKQETKGQKLEREGGYIDTGELDSGGKPLMIQGMPPAIDPEEHKRLQKQKKIRSIAEEGATEGERQAGRGKLKDQTQLPKFFKAIIDAKPSPADLLKILQFLPALTGGGLQMASSRSLREHLKPGTKGLRDYDKAGGGRGISDEAWLELIRSAPKV